MQSSSIHMMVDALLTTYEPAELVRVTYFLATRLEIAEKAKRTGVMAHYFPTGDSRPPVDRCSQK
jgi:hypothetical protein